MSSGLTGICCSDDGTLLRKIFSKVKSISGVAAKLQQVTKGARSYGRSLFLFGDEPALRGDG